MGLTAICENCDKPHRYDSSEINNAGTIWHPIWTVTCPHCGHVLRFDHGNIEGFDLARISRSREGVSVKRASQVKGYERAKKGDIREYWIQGYVKDNFKKLGFSQIKGPFNKGPDFNGVYQGKGVIIEVERTCQSFIEHGHHKDPRFKDVDILIILSPTELPEDLKRLLPKTIVTIDIDDFVEYWHPRARDYARAKEVEGILDLIAGEFQRRFVQDCTDKNRDMATCPECSLCPYFGEGTQEAPIVFEDFALQFIISYKHPIGADDFGLTSIDPLEIDAFYKRYMQYQI